VASFGDSCLEKYGVYILKVLQIANKGGRPRLVRFDGKCRSGDALRRWLSAEGVSAGRFARLLGVYPNTVSRWLERGPKPIPPIAEMVVRLVSGNGGKAVAVLEDAAKKDK
jgi:hypothetical protein